METFLRIEEVKAFTGLSRSTIWRLERDGHFPKRIRISRRAVAWRATEIEAWIGSRIAASKHEEGATV
jgi:prophage regulatory protein